jgi:L-iditol 2-dehydrogenase
MRALYYPAWDTLEMRDVPTPTPAPGEVLVKVAAVGICGSELHGFAVRARRRTPPIIMGHEFSGEIAALGSGVTGYRVGEPVAVNSGFFCGRCADCVEGYPQRCAQGEIFGTTGRAGAFAEYCAVPAASLLPLPQGVSPIQAALAEPLANGIHALSQTRRRLPETVLIIGAGTIGLFTLQIAREMGALCLVVSDISDARLAVARKLGADQIVNAAHEDVLAIVRGATRGRGAEVVVDAVGASETRRLAVAAARKGGEVVWLGLHDDRTELSGFDVVLGERTVYGSFAVTPRELVTALGLFAGGRIRLEPWVRTFPLEQGAQVFSQLVTAPPDDYIKAVLLP